MVAPFHPKPVVVEGSADSGSVVLTMNASPGWYATAMLLIDATAAAGFTVYDQATGRPVDSATIDGIGRVVLAWIIEKADQASAWKIIRTSGAGPWSYKALITRGRITASDPGE